MDKSDRRLDLIGDGKEPPCYAIALGGDPLARKRREGDERTPELVPEARS
jgi:murein L,D-transpeptidase YafK